MSTLKIENIIGFPIIADPKDICLDQIAEWLKDERSSKFFACANPHSLVVAMDDPVFQQALLSADLLTPDGSGIVLASKMLGGSIRQRITGADIFRGVCEIQNKSGGSVFFLGSTEQNLAAIRSRMAWDYPNIRVAGTYSPPYSASFSPSENDAMISAVNKACADVLWVGMTAPKQEKWIHENLSHIDVRFVGAIGAVFDFYTGNVKRSHPFFQRVGLEWLPRLLREPRRLWRRNFVSSPVFLAHVMASMIAGYR